MKKIVLYVLSFVLILTSAIIPLSVSADTTTTPIGYSASLVTTKVPDGTKSIAKYYEDYVANGNAHLVSGDNGKYTISSADELVMLSQLTNGKYIPQGQTEALAKPADGFRYVTFYLTADIDMNDLSEGLSFEPIGYQFDISQNTNSNRAMFCGVFDGMGHTIDNLTFDDSANKATNGCESGLFGLVTYARIKNLVLGEGCHFKANSNDNQSRVGAIAGLCWGSVQLTNVCSKATIGVADTLARCAQNPGGLIGLARGGATLTNCTNAGTVYGTTIAGGLVGYARNVVTFTDCRNTGYVKTLNTVSGKNDRATGGIIGLITDSKVCVFTRCVNNGEVEGSCNVGAIAGSMNGTSTFENCYNYGTYKNLTKDAPVGVAYGLFYGTTAPTTTTCEDRYGLVEAETKAAMLKTLCQVANGTTTASEKTSIRLITSVDGLGYQAVGFKLQFKNAAGQTSAEEMYWTSTVYTSIKGGDTVVTDYKASDEFAVSSKYFATVTIENLPKSEFGGTLTVTAMVKDKNGDIQYGETYSSVVQELFQTPALESSLDVSGAAVGNVTNNVLCTVDVEVKTERKNSLTVL